MLTVGTLILLVMAAMPLLNIEGDWIKWVYAFGAVLVLAERLTERYHGKNLRISRLFRIGKVSALLYCASAYFVIWPTYDQPKAWLALLMAGAVAQIYITFVYEHEMKKEAKKAAAADDKKKKK